MGDSKKHISVKTTTKDALLKLNDLAPDSILFIVDDKNNLIGSLTDGDIRRGLINGLTLADDISDFINSTPKYLRKGDDDFSKVTNFKENDYRIIPVLNKENDQIAKIVNFRKLKSYIPVDAVVMAGGRGERLRPLTDITPKPLLKIGNKPIIEHNIDRLISFGIDDFHISVKYLGSQIVDYFDDGKEKEVDIKYVWEDEPLGTIGALSLIDDFVHDYILLTNSDLLTNLDYENFFIDFITKDADISILTIPYKVDIPYAVLETHEDKVLNFKEKPTYTYFSNGGIYLIKKSCLKYIPKSKFFNATDFIEALIAEKMKVISYTSNGYWLDIGRHDDFQKAQRDLEYLNLKY